MLNYVARRLVLALITCAAISVLTFVIIRLPPGDFVDAYIANLAVGGSTVSAEQAAAMRREYGLDRPVVVQYGLWMGKVVAGDFGVSMMWKRPVTEVIGDRLWLTMAVSFAALLLTWLIALPIGIYSAARQYSIGDYIATTLGFIGLAIPNFLLALILMYLGFRYLGLSVGGLFTPEYAQAAWSWGKFWDLMVHLPLPAMVLALAGTAQLIRIMRANLLDELRKPYVVTARAKGISEFRAVMKYPVRAALNPFASSSAYLFPYLVSGSIVVSLVLGLPTVGPLLLQALVAQDMFLAGTIVLAARRAHGDRNPDLGSPADVDRAAHPAAGARMTAIVLTSDDRLAQATQLQLTWWRFRRHKLAVVSLVIVALFYLGAVFADFLAVVDPHATDARRSFIPPQMISLFDNGAFSPHVSGLKGVRDPKTFKLVYTPDPARKLPVALFVHGYPYNLFGLIPTDRHLLGIVGGQGVDGIFLLGTDQLGRDLFSRLIVATRISLSIGLAGVAFSLMLGILLGGVSGLYGGTVDTLIQRVIEVVRSIPTIPLWMGLAAALPNTWSVTQVYFAITLIISLVSWTELARVTRGRFLALREEDFVIAAELAGAGQMRIILRHMLPSFASHIIAATSLALPVMIVSETSLSFLGLGLRPPAISWGILLQDAQNVQVLAGAPWLLERGGAGHSRHSGLQLPRRWGARCRRPLWLNP